MKKLVVLSGAGMSRESGLKTFRETGGLWEEHDVLDVATPMAWAKDPDLVTRFYNERRKQLMEAEPNEGHIGLAKLEKYFDVHIITQNVDDLHERAGSTKVLHLHGELMMAKSTADPFLRYPVDGWELTEQDVCEKGSRLRPDVVWFGEPVPAMEEAGHIANTADVFVVAGSSLNVYPAAGLIGYAPAKASLWLIDPNDVEIPINRHVEVIKEKASKGVDILTSRLLNEYK